MLKQGKMYEMRGMFVVAVANKICYEFFFQVAQCSFIRSSTILNDV